MAKNREKTNEERSGAYPILIFIAIILLIAAIVVLCNSSLMNVDRVTVLGASRFDANEIIASLGVTGTNILKIDENVIKQKIEENPYIEVTDIKRVFPSSVEVYIREREPFMAVQYNGYWCIMDKECVALTYINTQESGVVNITGLEINAPEFGKVIGMDEEKLFGIKEIVKAAEETGLKVYLTKIDVAEQGKYGVSLNTGIDVIIGYANDVKTKFLQIPNVLQSLGDKAAAGGVLDLSIEGKCFFSATSKK